MADTKYVTVPATEITVFHKKTTYLDCGLEGLPDKKEKDLEGAFHED